MFDRVRQKFIRDRRTLVVCFTAAVTLSAGSIVLAQPIKIGRTTGGSGFHIPSYVAIDKGFLKAEGLDANFIAATAGVLVRAAIAKEIEFVPIPGGGSEAMLKGAPLVFFVGESLISQWTLTTTPAPSRSSESCCGRCLGGAATHSVISTGIPAGRSCSCHWLTAYSGSPRSRP